MNVKQKASKKKILIVGLVVVAVAAGGGYYYYRTHQKHDLPTAGTTSEPPVNNQPATDTEKKEADQTKDQIVEDQKKQASNTQTGKLSVKPTITTANTTTVTAYVSGVFENGGTCTATFASGGKTLTKTTTGFENASYTQCPPIHIESGFLSSGTWTVTVSYNSAKASGVSDPKTIEVK